MKLVVGLLGGLVLFSGVAACKKASAPSLPPGPSGASAPAAASAPTTTAVSAARVQGASPAAQLDAGGAPAVAVEPTESPVLLKFLAGAPHLRVVALAQRMLGKLSGGRCLEAMEEGRELAEAIRGAGGDFNLQMDVKAMAKNIQADPNFMDKPYMQYKSVLVGLAAGIELGPMTVKLAATVPAAQKKACDGFARLLRDIRLPSGAPIVGVSPGSGSATGASSASGASGR